MATKRRRSRIVAEIREWSLEFPKEGFKTVPTLLMGRIYNDKSGINQDGEFVRVGQIVGLTYMQVHKEYFLVVTESYIYKLYIHTKKKEPINGAYME